MEKEGDGVPIAVGRKRWGGDGERELLFCQLLIANAFFLLFFNLHLIKYVAKYEYFTKKYCITTT
jgi:hypothetical protein